ncbi:MAG: fibronectin type III domain-containing protein [Planctomycetota bacterium]
MHRSVLTITACLISTCLSLTAAAHETGDAHHWEIASPDPDRIFLTFIGDPATSRAVTWRTDKSVAQAYAEIAVATPGPAFANTAKRYEATTEPLTLDDNSKPVNQATHFHSVVFEDLRPNTLYAYRVGSGKRWSEWIQFRTASDKPEPFRFLYFGDAQNEVHSKWSRVIRMAHRTAPDAAFAIHAGDLVDKAHADHEWAEWMKAGGHLHAETTGVPVVGNHEYQNLTREGVNKGRHLAIHWRPQFTLPVEESLPEHLHETVYTIAYQGVQVIVLDSANNLEQQTAYLESKLGEGDYRWRVVTFHHPVFAPSRGLKKSNTRDAWKEVLEKMGADLVLQGHDHTYARGHTPRRSADDGQTDGLGAMYVTSVSGPKMYKIDQEGLAKFQELDGLVTAKTARNTQFFQVIDVKDGRLEYRAYTATGELYDAAAIEKDEQGNKKLVAIPLDGG